MIFRLSLFFLSLCLSLFATNPFWVDFPPKENLTNQDYVDLQKKLREINVEPLIRSLHKKKYIPLESFFMTCFKGIRQTLIDPDQGLFPEMHFEKVGMGSDMCIVSCTPFNNDYPRVIRNIYSELQKTGFNGYFLYLIGGFPNPTGREIQFAGVPYSFKIFMMMEAQKLGFDKVLWIDSSMLPLHDPTPIFNFIDRTGYFAFEWEVLNRDNCLCQIFDETRELLKALTGTDIAEVSHVCGRAFGLKMNTPEAQQLIKEYYRMVELGTPFLSRLPEEFVLSAILGKKEYSHWRISKINKMDTRAIDRIDTPQKIEAAKQANFLFWVQAHTNWHSGTPEVKLH